MEVIIENKMTLRQTVAGFIYLPFHYFILPLLLPRLAGVMPVSDATVNLIYYGLGVVFIAVIMMPYLRRCFDFLIDSTFLAVLIFFSMMGVYYLFSFGLTFAMELFELPLGQAPNDTQVESIAAEQLGVIKSLAIFAAPIVEETLFRGVIFGSIRGRSRWLAYAVSGVAFCLFHVWEYAIVYHDPGQLLYVIQYVPMAIALAYGYDKTGCIWIPIAFHMLNNAAAFAVSGL